MATSYIEELNSLLAYNKKENYLEEKNILDRVDNI